MEDAVGVHGLRCALDAARLSSAQPASRAERLRVAIVAACPFPANHGTPGGIREKAEALVELGHEVHIVTYAQCQSTQPVVGPTVHRIPRVGPVDRIVVGPSFARMYWDVLLAFKTISVAMEHDVDVIHALNYEGALAGAIASWVTGKPLVYGAVNTMIDELPTYKFMPPWLARCIARVLDYHVPRMADRIVCYTPAIRDFLVRAGVEGGRIDVTKLGIDLGMFRDPCPHAVRAARIAMHAENDPLVVYTGVLNRFQRLDYLLGAMKIVRKSLPTARLAFVQTVDVPDEQRQIEVLAHEFGLADAVVFPPVTSLQQLPAYVAAADATAIPRPDCPGVPVKLINFMAAGRPVVVTRGSGQGLTDGVEALISEDHDVPGMARALVRVLTDKELAERLGRSARAHAYAEYDRLATTRKLVASYRSALDRAALAAARAPATSVAGTSSPGTLAPAAVAAVPAMLNAVRQALTARTPRRIGRLPRPGAHAGR